MDIASNVSIPDILKAQRYRYGTCQVEKKANKS